MHGLGAEFPGSRGRLLPGADWLTWFNSLTNYTFNLNITGGEPLAHPDFRLMIETLDANNRATFEICTNMSYDPFWISSLRNMRLLWCSLHDIHNTNWVTKFKQRVEACRLGNQQLEIHVNIVTQPDWQIVYETLIPWADQHRLLLRKSDYDGTFRNHRQVPLDPPGMALCSAGRDLLSVWPDGSVYRCFGHGFLKFGKLGNIKDGFQPSASDTICDLPNCASCDVPRLSTLKRMSYEPASL